MIRYKLKNLVLVCLFATSSLFAQKSETVRNVVPFEENWKFIQKDVAGAEKPDYNDNTWKTLSVPHDWSIEGPYDRNNTTGRGGGYLPGGIGWYRKSFTIPQRDAGKKIYIEFDGIMANSDVWVNGKHLGQRPNGYVGFRYELGPHLVPGKTNIIAVRADNSVQPASRWYTGAGIYRHVRLITANPVHVDQWGVFITAKDVSDKSAMVNVKTAVLNESGSSKQITLQTALYSPDGKILKTSESKQLIPAGKSADISQDFSVNKPQLWDIQTPHIYQAVTRILSDKTVLDDEVTTFGIRNFRFDAATGFYLNGKNMKIKGVCLHHDGGSVGAAVPASIWKKRLVALKELGVNGIRTAHNPMAPEFYDLCDQLGLLVMDETFDTWRAKKANGENGYNLYFDKWWEADTRDVIKRDRNHPSIIMYSVGNEIRDDLSPANFKTFTDQRDLINRLDGTRPITMALFRPNSAKVYDNGFVELMDIVGQNYRESELVAAHESKPERKVIGTENGHQQEAWLILRDKPYMAGQFLWTGIDYFGEANWPSVGNPAGILDRTGAIKPRGYQRQSWWSDKPMVYISRSAGNAGGGQGVSDWTPADFDTYDEAHVQVYSNCEEVELFHNGKSLGVKPLAKDASPFSWKVTFAPGTLKAVGKNKGKIAAEYELKTAGKPAAILLTSDQTKLSSNFDDAALVTAVIVDENGIPCPNSDNTISFKVSGAGRINSVDNGLMQSTESYKGSERRANRGRAVALIQANGSKGKIEVLASADGLKSGIVTLNLVP
ncbi:glycoside hydrolase family 2 TIM barrel-domain containing protein [Paradesertivirga mongoliensis]|uniref:Glycoside hydrolase family 2 TIM barrel-domain containing protein n=1 Tax=Paradesertivirga mongoliensis TaxID=2100740 RepID=A0ABW4ZJC1_9SPHI|nr:glycoside hydrolase family 2 TIM barrel-domain containing protein [Pedobacter mongoliensis]